MLNILECDVNLRHDDSFIITVRAACVVDELFVFRFFSLEFERMIVIIVIVIDYGIIVIIIDHTIIAIVIDYVIIVIVINHTIIVIVIDHTIIVIVINRAIF